MRINRKQRGFLYLSIFIICHILIFNIAAHTRLSFADYYFACAVCTHTNEDNNYTSVKCESELVEFSFTFKFNSDHSLYQYHSKTSLLVHLFLDFSSYVHQSLCLHCPYLIVPLSSSAQSRIVLRHNFLLCYLLS